MGGAIVFPGRQARRLRRARRVDAAHHAAAPSRARRRCPSRSNDAHFRSLAIAGARETLEEAAILHVQRRKGDAGATSSRCARSSRRLPDALRAFLVEAAPAARPRLRSIRSRAGSRRRPSRVASTRASSWPSRPKARRASTTSTRRWRASGRRRRRCCVASRRGEVQLMPPTHRTIALLAECDSTAAVLAMAESSNLDPICPRLVKHGRPRRRDAGARPAGRSRARRPRSARPGPLALRPPRGTMAIRRSPQLTARATARRGSSASPPSSAANVYSAQILANFCEVDLKTVHHWADRGKVPHFRTDGRHLRFRRNDVVRFLRAHGYPLPDALVRARPTVALALGASLLEGASLSLEDLAKRLGSRFSLRRHGSGARARSRISWPRRPTPSCSPIDDPTLGFPARSSRR